MKRRSFFKTIAAAVGAYVLARLDARPIPLPESRALETPRDHAVVLFTRRYSADELTKLSDIPKEPEAFRYEIEVDRKDPDPWILAVQNCERVHVESTAANVFGGFGLPPGQYDARISRRSIK